MIHKREREREKNDIAEKEEGKSCSTICTHTQPCTCTKKKKVLFPIFLPWKTAAALHLSWTMLMYGERSIWFLRIEERQKEKKQTMCVEYTYNTLFFLCSSNAIAITVLCSSNAVLCCSCYLQYHHHCTMNYFQKERGKNSNATSYTLERREKKGNKKIIALLLPATIIGIHRPITSLNLPSCNCSKVRARERKKENTINQRVHNWLLSSW